MFRITNNSNYEDMPIGGDILLPGNSREYKTGDWRTKRPVWIQENCMQCGLCWPTCPDDAIPLDKDEKQRKDFDYDYCKGCGVCAKVCPFNAIEMRKEI